MITEEHYKQLPGLRSPWSVAKMDLSMETLRVDIYVEHLEQTDKCPECGASCRIYDEAAERIWRHLDTMQFETLLHARVPLVKYPKHGVRPSNQMHAATGRSRAIGLPSFFTAGNWNCFHENLRRT